MKLRKPCQHGRYDEHTGFGNGNRICPGGVFLPDDTLIIEKVDGEWPKWFVNAAIDEGVRMYLDALSVRESPEVDKNQMEVPFTNEQGAW